MGSKDYLKGIKMIIYIFDVTNEESIKHFKDNAEKLFINADNNAFKYVFGKYSDYEEKIKVKDIDDDGTESDVSNKADIDALDAPGNQSIQEESQCCIM